MNPNSRTQELTYGAMLVAVFGVLLLVNRQTAGLFEDVIFFVLPIPMTIFSLRYGWKDSIPVYVCMVALSFFLGTLYTIFYAITNALLGIVLGLLGARTYYVIFSWEYYREPKAVL